VGGYSANSWNISLFLRIVDWLRTSTAGQTCQRRHFFIILVFIHFINCIIICILNRTWIFSFFWWNIRHVRYWVSFWRCVPCSWPKAGWWWWGKSNPKWFVETPIIVDIVHPEPFLSLVSPRLEEVVILEPVNRIISPESFPCPGHDTASDTVLQWYSFRYSVTMIQLQTQCYNDTATDTVLASSDT